MKSFTWIIVYIFAFAVLTFSQNYSGQRSGSGTISGTVYDANANAPIEYANIVLYDSKDSSQVTGGITNSEGKFRLTNIRSGNFYLDVQFIGYEKKTIRDITISQSNRNIDLGDLYIEVSEINLQDVVVEGQRSPVTYQVDKKVIDVSQMSTSISGNAAEVLENIPSVSVDIDGNVSLRGSNSFTVLIDGRPSVLDAQDALQQIPATSIETIEIITNPSAKYDPEGNAGIINIKMKKNRNLGLSGIVTLNAGVNDKYGGDFIFQYKTPEVSYNFGLDYNRRFSPGTGRQVQTYDYANNTSFVNSSGNREWGRISFGFNGGIEFNIDENDFLSFSGRYGDRDRRMNSTSNYLEWSLLDPQRVNYLNQTQRQRSGPFYSLAANYNHKYGEEHELSAELSMRYNNTDETTITSDFQNSVQFQGKKTTEDGPSTDFEGKLDYTLSLGENRKFEAGAEGEIDITNEATGLFDYDSQLNDMVFQDLYSHDVKSNETELAIYSLYADEWNNLGFQGGVRTEYTYRTIELVESNQKFSINRWDFFPSFHSSYKFSDNFQLMASYSRRIDRPGGWNLEPFLTWMDANNVRRGNPGLQPEYIDSYEFGFQTFFGNITFSNDFYYRINHNNIDWIRSVYSENVTLTTFENVGTEYSAGSEFMLTTNLFELWEINLMGNLYNYRTTGVLYDVDFERSSFNWSSRISNSFKVGKSTQLQLNVRYNSPSVSSQGRWEGFFTTDVAVKQDFMNKNLSLTLQVRDLLQTSKREFFSQGEDFYTHNYFTRESPMVMLNLRFNFNNFKDNERRGGDDNGFGGEDL